MRLGGRHNMPRPTLTFDLEVGVGVACDLGQSFIFLGLLVFELEPMYATSDSRQMDGQTDDGRRSPLNAPAPPTGRGHNNE